MTIKELKRLCERQIAKGNGDRKIIVASDDEGNGGHIMYYGFTENVSDAIAYSPIDEKDEKDYVVLG